MRIIPLYSAIGCNKKSHVLHTSSNGTVCYAGANSLCFFNPSTNPLSLTCTISLPLQKQQKENEGRITCLRFVKPPQLAFPISSHHSVPETIGIVTGSHKSICLFAFSDLNSLPTASPIKCIPYPEQVTCIDAVAISGTIYVAVAGTSASFSIAWNAAAAATCQPSLDSVQIHKTVATGKCLVTAIALVRVDCDVLVGVALSDCRIGLYSISKDVFVCWLNGHENWISCIDVVECRDGSVRMISASHDKYIRVWTIARKSVEGEMREREKGAREVEFCIENEKFSVTFESLLMGHDNWVYSAQWVSGTLDLISTSADRTVIVWQWNSADGSWKPSVHLGTLSGGSSQGIYGAYLLSSNLIIANDYSGSLLCWKKTKKIGNGDGNDWKVMPSITGHFDSVNDLVWDEKGILLLTVSSDQTSRIHSQLSSLSAGADLIGVSTGESTDAILNSKLQSTEVWHEIARPQIHGYDLKCAAFLNGLRFVSGADEKCIRAFEGTRSFLHSFLSIAQALPSDRGIIEEWKKQVTIVNATVPALGLSNKSTCDDSTDNLNGSSKAAIDDSNNSVENDQKISLSQSSSSNNLDFLTESYLSAQTLWPETDKLYGHVFELFSLTYSPTLNLIASTAKSFKTEYGNVLIWSSLPHTSTLTLHQSLLNIHSLTVTRTSFSPSSNYLLTVSRDRSICLFACINGQFSLFHKRQEAHSRIIWDCCWISESEFVTVSRDETLKIWRVGNASFDCIYEHSFSSSCTSVDSVRTDMFFSDFTSVEVETSKDWSAIVAVGMENGTLALVHLKYSAGTIALYDKSEIERMHGGRISRARWGTGFRLATCSSANSVKIHRIVPT